MTTATDNEMRFELSQVVQTVILVVAMAIAWGKLDARVSQIDRDQDRLSATVVILTNEVTQLRITIAEMNARPRR